MTGGVGVQAVLDMVGGDYVPRNIACLADDGRHVSIAHVLPWFILGFAVMAALRAADLFSPAALSVLASASSLFTTMAMAGLGLTVDVRSLRQAGGRVILAAAVSLVALCIISMAMIRLLGIL